MRFDGKIGVAALLGVLMVWLAGPAFAGGRNFSEAKVVNVDGGIGKTNPGDMGGCHTAIVCKPNGGLDCNGGVLVHQCQAKAR